MAIHTDENGMTVYGGRFWDWARVEVAILIHVATAGGFFAFKAAAVGKPSSGLGWALMLGFILWTLFEYVVHRWLFHQTWHPILRKIYVHAHLPHHRTRRIEDPFHRALHPLISVPSLLPHYLWSTFLCDGLAPLVGVCGFAIGYCVYELFHYVFHATSLPTRLAHIGWVARKHAAHVSHHFTHVQSNFGFTTHLWDRAFGTYVATPPSAEVSARLAATSEHV